MVVFGVIKVLKVFFAAATGDIFCNGVDVTSVSSLGSGDSIFEFIINYKTSIATLNINGKCIRNQTIDKESAPTGYIG